MFNRIIGHGDVLSILGKMLTDGRPEGVYLFHGPKSVGKYTVARDFAMMSVCTGILGHGCACDNCRLFPTIPDFMQVDDGQNVIKVDDVDSIGKFLSLAPYSAKRRAVIVDDADRMNKQSSYGLLGTLENIGERAVIILVTSEGHKISPAIVSRCVPIQFGSLHKNEISSILTMQGHPRFSIDGVCKIMPFLSGSILRDFATYNNYIKRMPSILKSMSKGSDEDVLQAVSDAVDSGKTIHFIECMVSTLCDVVKTHYDCPQEVVAQSVFGEIENLTEYWSVDVCIASCAKLGEVLQAIRSPLNLKIGPRLQAAVSWMSLYVAQTGVKKKMSMSIVENSEIGTNNVH